jgi:lipopolysaccharide transport system ATP-binding protein
MAQTVIEINDLGKHYRLGQLSSRSVGEDLKRWWYHIRGKEDPFLKLGEENDRTKKATSNYVWALKDINLKIEKGEVLGIIGRNGAGKSTLLKILSRTTGPTTGEYKIKGKVTSLLEVGTGFHPELSGRDNIFLNGSILGMKKKEIQQKFDEILDFSGVERYIDTPVKRYSSGMYVRLAFAVAAHLEPDILIVDEVLAVGDQEFQDKCIGKMKDVSGQGRTVLFVSHNMGAIKQLCTRVTYLENGLIKATGDPSEVINKYFAKDDDKLFNGMVPRDYARSYNNGSGFIDFISTVNEDSSPKSKYFFREPVSVTMKFELMENIKDLMFSITVLNDEMQKISYYEYPENSSKTLSLEKGTHSVDFNFADSFLPGKYFLAPSLLQYTGTTIDYIERIAPFEVSADSIDGSHNYKWDEKHGNSFMKLQTISIK